MGPDRGYTLDSNNCAILAFDIVRVNRDGSCPAVNNILPDRPELPDLVVAAALASKQRELQLQSIPRWRVPVARQHVAIRKDERQLIVTALRDRHLVWVVADWGLGKDGFLASALEEYSGSEPDAFVLECGEGKTSADLQSLPETQFGLSFQEFFAHVGASHLPVLIFDDLPVTFANGDERNTLESAIIQPIRDFCPNLAMIFVSRQKPRLTREEEIVALRAIDIHETRQYISHHADAQADLADGGNLEKIQDWSEGLPMRLDYLIEEVRGCSLSDFFDERGEISLGQAEHAEPVPRALRDAVGTLAEATEGTSYHSFRLLKVLSVLRDGEVFHAVKRFYQTDPFHLDNVSELMKLELLEAVPIAQTAAELSGGASRTKHSPSDIPKLLHVPPQVRTYVNGFISKEERDEILRTSTELLFGTAWRNGSIHLRKELERSYSETSIGGPGNERFVALYLVRESLISRDDHQIKRSVQLGLGLCKKLIALDWFRDALTSTESMVQLLRDTELKEEYAEAARLHANALRMMDEHEAAIEMNQIALDEGSSYYTNDVKGGIFTELALSYDSLGRNEEALKAAERVLTLSGPESSDGYQAQSVIAQRTIDDPKELERRLLELMRHARRKGHDTPANNIALELVRRGKNPTESLKYLDDVFRTSKGNYTRARAIINKATLLTKLGRESDLELRDRELLGAAYDYSYGQRISKLLERCHVALWDIFTKEGLLSSLVRLFRLSSFFWRLKGIGEQESKYIRRLDMVDLNELKRIEGRTIESEIHYLERRREDLPPSDSNK